MTFKNLHTRAMLANLSIRSWSARKYDRKVTEETNAAHGAGADAGRYNKNLLPGDAASYKALTSHISAARLRHYAQSLPWSDAGWRLLPVKNYQAYQDQTRDDQHTFDTLLAEFLRDYPALRDAARVQLNGLWNEDDYPHDVAARFSFAVDFSPVPQEGDYRVELSQEEIDILTSSTASRVQAAFEAAQNDAVNRLYKVLAKMRERLTTIETCSKCDGNGTTIETRKRPDKGQTVTCWICDGTGKTEATFRDSLTENALEVSDVLKRINLTEDSQLETFRAEIEALANRANPETLRDNPQVKNDTAARAQSILEAMQATYGTAVIV